MANAINIDGWNNLHTSLGTKKDRTRGQYSAGVAMSDQELKDVYNANGLGRKIIDLPVDEMLREWIQIETEHIEDAELILKEFRRLKLKTKLGRLIKMARLFGGAVMVVHALDANLLETPLNLNQLHEIEGLHIYDKRYVTWNQGDLYQDPQRSSFNEIEFYRINPQSRGLNQEFRVHESRVIVVQGLETDDETFYANSGWNLSYLEPIYTELKNVGLAMGGTANIITDFIQATLTIEDLTNLIASGQEEVVMKRLELLDKSRSIINTILLDKDEVYEKKSSSVSGLDGLLVHFQVMLSAVTDIPVTKLFGRSPAGMNATGQSDTDNFYAKIKSEQEDVLEPILTRLIEIVVAQKDRKKFKHRDQEEYTIKFNPLSQPTAKEEAETYKINTEADVANINAGVLDPTEVAESRFGGDEYGKTIQLDKDLRREELTINRNPESEPEDPSGDIDATNSR